MKSPKRLSSLLWVYILSLITVILVLISWVIYVVHAYQRINEMIIKVGGGSGENYHWLVLALGCVLIIALIVGLSLQFAQALIEFRYNQKQNEFISNITHELNSPLAAIKLHTQTLQQEGLEAQEKKRFLNHILQQANRMELLVENLLEASRMQSKVYHLNLERIGLKNFFAQYIEETKDRIASQKISFQYDIKTQATILANPLSLHRVLDNLIENAVKATQTGQSVGLTTQDFKTYVEISVWDEGVGIPKKEQKKIFDRFYQIGAEIRGKRKGTGLGLAIVKKLVEEMKGHIKVISPFREQKGSVFVIQFPREKS